MVRKVTPESHRQVGWTHRWCRNTNRVVQFHTRSPGIEPQAGIKDLHCTPLWNCPGVLHGLRRKENPTPDCSGYYWHLTDHSQILTLWSRFGFSESGTETGHKGDSLSVLRHLGSQLRTLKSQRWLDSEWLESSGSITNFMSGGWCSCPPQLRLLTCVLGL